MGTDTAVRAGLYCRLSVEDEQEKKTAELSAEALTRKRFSLRTTANSMGLSLSIIISMTGLLEQHSLDRDFSV